MRIKTMSNVAVLCWSVLTFPAYGAGTNVAYYGPVSYANMLTKSYTPTLSLSTSGITTNRGRYLLSTASKASTAANYLSIKATYNATTGYPAQSVILPTQTTYGTYLSALFQAVASPLDTTGFYRLDSHLHSNYSLDADEAAGYTLKFRNNAGKTSTPYGYVVFSYDASTNYLRAEKRYSYTLNQTTTTDARGKAVVTYSPSYTEDMNFANRGAGYYVNYTKGVYKLVPQRSQASKLYFYTSSDDYGIPNRFNPASTLYASNPPAPYMSTVTPDAVESGSGAFYTKINNTYRSQVETAGSDAKTKLAADQFLATMSTALAVKGDSLRYAPALYTAFRDAALAGKLASAAPVDGVLGQKLVPFVYFTNEMDTAGRYHPFMNVVTYTVPGSPQGLLDIPGPPFLGQGSTTTPVTRYANLGYFIARIPMKDYGQVSNVKDNAMQPKSDSWALNLLSDSHCGASNPAIPTCPAEDNYNYASTAEMGILIDGSILFPLLNNALMPSQWKGELSTYGCHVGQGGEGPHCHSDGFSTGQRILTLYNDSDYANKSHPPLIGFGYDGVALFGVYRQNKDTGMLGYSVSLDAFGGHNHDGVGYHYHAHTAILPDSYNVNSNGFHIEAKNTPVNVLLKGAWAGNINTVPYFGYRADFMTNKYLGGK